MTTLPDAIKRLTLIQIACSPVKKGQSDGERLDDFTSQKKYISTEIKRVRETLEERDELIRLGKGTKEIAEMSARIRTAVKVLKEEIKKFEKIQQDESKKKDKSKDIQKLEDRSALVQLAWQHIEELEMMEKKRFLTEYTDNRSKLMAGGRIDTKIRSDAGLGTGYSTGTSYGGGDGNGATNRGSNLPDLDIGEDMAQIQANDRILDKDMDIISSQLGVVRQIATAMGEELEKQNGMLEEVEKKVDRAGEKLENINVSMKKAVDGVMKGDKFMVNCILLCVLLAVISYIATKFT